MAAPAASWLAVCETAVPTDDEWLTGPEAARLAAMRFTKRRLESRLGRWTAKQAVAGALRLQTGAPDTGQVSIVNAPDGAPEAFVDGEPIGIAISMTDRAGWAVCITLPGAASVGCDLELVEPRSAAFVADYFTPPEQAAVAAADNHDLMANAIWSAKESALKVLRTGLRRATRSVEVTLDGDGNGWHPLEVVAAEGDRFPGWWIRFGEFVLTVAASVPTASPVSQVEPPPLAEAEPLHSWMDAPLIG